MTSDLAGARSAPPRRVLRPRAPPRSVSAPGPLARSAAAWPAVLVCVAVLCAAAGCKEDARVHPPRQRTMGEARLPPTPDLSPQPPLAVYDDGALSVHGVLTSGARKKGELLTVRGYVAAIHVCGAGEAVCKPAPYVQLTDAESLQGRRLLVGGPIDPARDRLKVGKRADVRGRFVTSSPDGLYFAPQGLLLFEPPEPVAGDRSGGVAAP